MDDMQFTQEVTRSDLSLAEAIEAGEVPVPPLMGWRAWQSWRKYVGKRPTTNVDGGTTHNRLESKLWKATMESLYGEEWMVELDDQGGGPDPSEFAKPSAARASEAAAQRDGGDTLPSAGAAATASGGAAVSTPEPKSPVVRSPPNRSPGSGKADSWDSKSPGSPGALGEKASRPYDPFQKTYDEYEARLRRQAEILDASGFPIPHEEVSHRLLKA